MPRLAALGLAMVAIAVTVILLNQEADQENGVAREGAAPGNPAVDSASGEGTADGASPEREAVPEVSAEERMQDEEWRARYEARLDEAYAKVLAADRKRKESGQAREEKMLILMVAKNDLQDLISSEVYRLVVSEDCGGEAPAWLTWSIGQSTAIGSLELPANWQEGEVPYPIMQPVTRLALEAGVEIRPANREEHEPLIADLTALQRRALVATGETEYLRWQRKQCIYRAANGMLPQEQIEDLTALDETYTELLQEAEEAEEAYLRDVLALLQR